MPPCTPPPLLQDCWAKTDPESGRPVLTVRDHCIHVGAVAEYIGQLLPSLTKKHLPSGYATLAALHDVGKITLGFQKKCPSWTHFSSCNKAGLEGNHSLVSHAFLGDYISHKKSKYWSISLGGHHGRYSFHKSTNRGFNETGSEWAQPLREELASELITLFGALPDSEDKPDPYLIHWFTGLITFADWIGSNTDFFPLPENQDLEHLASKESAQTSARSALGDLLWNDVKPREAQQFTTLFPFPPNELQKTLSKAVTIQGLYIVEATMGMGKTEAAFTAAYQRWETGEERGIYFALPTQLTSNRIFNRIKPFLDQAIATSSPLSLVHGNSWLTDERTQHINASNTADQQNGSDALRWFSSSRRALLSPFGVGTIDQALLSVLHTKYASLRFFGLAGKTVILDEVHSYDDYTFNLICKLVKELTKKGSTVIILSATLTHEARQKLVLAAEGSEEEPVSAYPLITAVKRTSNGQVTEHFPVRDTSPSKNYSLCHITLDEGAEQDDGMLDSIASAAENGACVLVIRNTVKLAQSTYDSIKSRVGEHVPVGLLHSRFPQFRREEIEQEWVGYLEKGSLTRPDGCILIATQIVEQSVDIDADLLVTDLSPTDLILQRLGRLHRHERSRPSGFESPQCWILHPHISEETDAKVLKKQLGSSAWIYPPHNLIQSSSVWQSREKISLPEDIRTLLETTAAGATATSPAIDELKLTQLADTRAKAGTASTRTKSPISTNALNDDDQGNQTRWNSQPSATLVMLSQEPTRLGSSLTLHFLNGEKYTTNLHAFDFKLAKMLHKNAVRIPAYLLGKTEICSEWLDGYFFEKSALAIPQHSTGGHCHIPNATAELSYQIQYTQNSGISFTQLSAPTQLYEDEEECWW